MKSFQIGDKVVLHTPSNPRLHLEEGKVKSIEKWGYIIDTPAAATQEYRATIDELIQITPIKQQAKDMGYTGNICSQCSSVKMRRNGTCELCEECGSTSGCS